MVVIEQTWAEMKVTLIEKSFKLQYEDRINKYYLFAVDASITYECFLRKTDPASTDQEDFEDNYKDKANHSTHPVTPEGKPEIMSSSRPEGTTVAFITAGDKISVPQEIHGGTEMKWDFSNTDDDVTAPTNFKRKQFDIEFIDGVWLKEGSVYFHNTPKGAYVSFEVVCPDGEYYKKNDGTIALATSDTVVHKYVAKHYIQGDCQMGDELNTEAATLDPLPIGYWMRITVTTPDTDSTSNGYAEIELYRSRTVILE